MAHKLTLYHGTSRDFINFDKKPDKIKNATYSGMSDSDLGIFFIDNEIMAKWFAGVHEYNGDNDEYEPTGKQGKLIVAEVSFKKPLIFKNELDNWEDSVQEYFAGIERYPSVEEFKKTLIEAGYDSVLIVRGTTNYYAEGSYNILVAFDKSQVKIKQSIDI